MYYLLPFLMYLPFIPFKNRRDNSNNISPEIMSIINACLCVGISLYLPHKESYSCEGLNIDMFKTFCNIFISYLVYDLILNTKKWEMILHHTLFILLISINVYYRTNCKLIKKMYIQELSTIFLCLINITKNCKINSKCDLCLKLVFILSFFVTRILIGVHIIYDYYIYSDNKLYLIFLVGSLILNMYWFKLILKKAFKIKNS